MPKMSDQMLAWSVEMGPYCLQYKPHASIKAQALTDLIVKCSFDEGKGSDNSGEKMNETRSQLTKEREDDYMYWWYLHVDRAAGPIRNGAGAILEGLDGLIMSYALRFNFPMSNNMAKYEAFINGMQLAMGIEEGDLKVFNDSQLVVNQVKGVYEAHDETMKRYLARA